MAVKLLPVSEHSDAILCHHFIHSNHLATPNSLDFQQINSINNNSQVERLFWDSSSTQNEAHFQYDNMQWRVSIMTINGKKWHLISCQSFQSGANGWACEQTLTFQCVKWLEWLHSMIKIECIRQFHAFFFLSSAPYSFSLYHFIDSLTCDVKLLFWFFFFSHIVPFIFDIKREIDKSF